MGCALDWTSLVWCLVTNIDNNKASAKLSDYY
jgi:hypothetical protein